MGREPGGVIPLPGGRIAACEPGAGPGAMPGLAMPGWGAPGMPPGRAIGMEPGWVGTGPGAEVIGPGPGIPGRMACGCMGLRAVRSAEG